VFAPSVQVGVVAGVVVGLVAPSLSSAVSTAVISCVVGAFVGPVNAWIPAEALSDRAAVALVSGAAAVGVAALVKFALRRGAVRPSMLVWAVIALLIGNMWATTLSVNAQSMFDPVSQAAMPSFNEQLKGDIPDAVAQSDDAWFYRVLLEVKAGVPYYQSFHRALVDNPRWQPASPMDYRLPTWFYLAALLPGPTGLPWAFLTVATLGVASVAVIGRGIVKTPLVVPACAAAASYFVYFPVQLPLLSQEAWAAAIGLMACAAFFASFRSAERWRALTVAAVLFAVTATLVRETIVFLPMAGLASTFVMRDERTRFRLAAWGAGCGALVVAYAAHVVVTRPLITPTPDSSRLWKGSVAAVVGAVDYATDMIGQGGPLPFVLAALGIAGIALLPDLRLKVFGAVAAIAPLASFLIVGNRAWYETTGTAINYWGATVMPLLIAFGPAAFRLVPGAALEGPQGRLR